MTENLPATGGPSALIELAITQGADLDKIEKMLILQERWESGEAKKAYIKAMTAFKADPPKIEKDQKVSYKQTQYSHASLSNVTEKINKSLSDHGLSAAWSTTQENGSVTVICTITHSQGHSENTSLTAQPDNSGSKNAIQALGSTISYLERYTILALTGLATHDMDTDGQAAEPVERITDKQKSTILDLINEKEVDETKFCQWIGAENIEAILAKDFNKAVSALQAKKTPERQPGDEG